MTLLLYSILKYNTTYKDAKQKLPMPLQVNSANTLVVIRMTQVIAIRS